MSSVLSQYNYRKATLSSVEYIVPKLSDIEREECYEISGEYPEELLPKHLDTMFEVLTAEGAVIGLFGVTRECGVILPWILIDPLSEFNKFSVIPFIKEFLQSIWEPQDKVILVLKIPKNIKQIRFLKALGFKRNPQVILQGHSGGEIHEYIINKEE